MTGVVYSTDGKNKEKPKRESKSGSKAMGNLGESYAKGYLKRLGYRIIRSPFSCRSGDIDVIALDNDTLVFVEVKTRRNRRFGSPLEAVTPTKQRQIAKIATIYLTYYNNVDFRFCRFDVLGICINPSTGTNDVEHVKDAFRLDGAGYSFSC